ncbi:MAG: Ni/Fe-hydrogenase, b-type cytochrome subunit [Dysgonamonadaceae bacterium]|jgi:Ni/Fe-hydrogenase 1 B-type cytochrome subunit|nr:Ni/Fe-hydrogenase, b-type cytochrome subunit [Dysgonamonadaceae bacterium]
MSPTKNYKRAYIWELGVRLFHWLNAFSLAFLIVSGLLIAYLPAFLTNAEASNFFLMGYIRMLHFVCAYIVIAVMILRIYLAFFGNKFANWRVFFPFLKKGWVNQVWKVLKYDILLQNEKEYNFKNIHVGHNEVAALSYLGVSVLGFIMVCTGFAMYAPNASWFFPKMFVWVVNLFDGDEQKIRMVHHFTMWLFIPFIITHIYLVFYHDWLEGRGETSAMISGYKFVRSERIDNEKESDPNLPLSGVALNSDNVD